MPNDHWGHCQHCKYFGSPAAAPIAGEEATCEQPGLARYKLRVFGACGCTLFELRAGFDESVEQPAQAFAST